MEGQDDTQRELARLVNPASSIETERQIELGEAAARSGVRLAVLKAVSEKERAKAIETLKLPTGIADLQRDETVE